MTAPPTVRVRPDTESEARNCPGDDDSKERESGMKTSAKMPTPITYVAATRGEKVVCETTAACSQSVAVAFQMAQSVGGAKGMLVWKKRRGGGRKSQDGGRETGGDKGLFGHHPSLPLPLFQRERRQKNPERGRMEAPFQLATDLFSPSLSPLCHSLQLRSSFRPVSDCLAGGGGGRGAALKQI